MVATVRLVALQWQRAVVPILNLLSIVIIVLRVYRVEDMWC